MYRCTAWCSEPCQGYDYDYDKTIKKANKDISSIKAQIAALSGATSDSAKARLAKLQAELSEKEENLADTRYDHQIELQQQGYDKLSEDMQEALDDSIDLINGDHEKLIEICGLMLKKLEENGDGVSDTLKDIIEENQTAISKTPNYNSYEIDQLNQQISQLESTMSEKQATAEQERKLADASRQVAHQKLQKGKTEEAKEAKEKALNHTIAAQNAAAEAAQIAVQIQELNQQKADILAQQPYKGDYTQEIIDKLGGTDGVESLLTTIGLDLESGILDIVMALQNRSADERITNIDTSNSVSTEDTKDIEDAIRSNRNQSRAEDSSAIGVETKRKQKEAEEKAKQEEAARQAAAAAEAERQRQADAAAAAAAQAAAQSAARKAQYQEALKTLVRTVTNIEKYPNSKHINQWIANRDAAKATIRSLGGQIIQASNGKVVTFDPVSFASGSKRIDEDQLAWTNENWNKNGSEMIIRKSDNAILTPLKANDAVIPANLVDNLFKWGAINPDSFATNPFMGKWGDAGSGKDGSMFSNNTNTQNVDVHFDSLITVQGNVDSDVVGRLEDLSKSLTSNKDFQQNVIKFVTKDFVKESRKLGMR